MKPHFQDAYQGSSSKWTRIEMLLALYNGVIGQLERAVSAQAEENQSDEINAKLRAAALMEAIEMGLDDAKGEELTQSIRRLCGYVKQCLVDGDSDSLRAAIMVLSNLRDGYEGIREEANAMERSGEIPPLEEAPELNTLA